ncbi:helix-turn-helix domain-containing protein [Actinokineospora bangkokensis]|uniref:Uncharacterized protein n=1 Tax=Actinokineospora bangkokensis TaxID=1193682 RepID=A0A1Q9LII8_9PSEU|nr:PucR family transcriptional regulator [Actinokineospora bangkokensis]OLR91833.1 hypothetical protein BJP25_23625 [Actinokineospora bangkokensis]
MLDAPLAEYLRLRIPVVVESVVAAVRSSAPGCQADAGELRAAVGVAVEHGVALASETGADQQRWVSAMRAMGSTAAAHGLSATDLFSAVHTGARAALRDMHNLTDTSLVDQRQLLALTDAVFAYTEALCSVVGEGHRARQAAVSSSGARDALAALLLGAQPASRERVIEAAAAAHWVVPDKVVVVAFAGEGLPEHQCDAEVLTLESAPAPSLVVPTGHKILTEVEDVSGLRVALSPEVDPVDVQHGHRLARRALELATTGALRPAGVIRCEEHLTALMHPAGRMLVEQFERSIDSALAGLPESRKRRLQHTLRAWAQARGHQAGMAQVLGVHPTTISYRMAQLEKVLGDRLHDPQWQFMLRLAQREQD